MWTRFVITVGIVLLAVLGAGAIGVGWWLAGTGAVSAQDAHAALDLLVKLERSTGIVFASAMVVGLVHAGTRDWLRDPPSR